MSDDLVQRLRAFPNAPAEPALCEEAANALARKDAEIAELMRSALHDTARIIEQGNDLSDMNDELRSIYAQRDKQRQRAERAEARVREAPVARVERWAGAAWVLHKRDLETVHPPIVGKRVALVLLDTEE